MANGRCVLTPVSLSMANGRCVLTPVSLSMDSGKHVLHSGCNFNNCTISNSGNPITSSENQSRSSPGDVDKTKLFEGISVDELYDD